jgi:hypothetical protein
MDKAIDIINENQQIKGKCCTNFNENKSYCEEKGVNLLTYTVDKYPNNSVRVNLEFFRELPETVKNHAIE